MAEMKKGREGGVHGGGEDGKRGVRLQAKPAKKNKEKEEEKREWGQAVEEVRVDGWLAVGIWCGVQRV